MFNLFGKKRKSVEEQRVPPGQKVVKRWPVLHAGAVPKFDRDEWTLRVFGHVAGETVFSWEEFCALPSTRARSDVHCVTGWSLLDNEWEGVSFQKLMEHTEVLPGADYVVVHDGQGYSANMPLDVLLRDGVLLATKHNGVRLSPEHGYPVRLVVPGLYLWKSVKWVRGIEFLPEDRRGFWESRGYHNEGDAWKEQRYRAQEKRE